MILSGLMPYLTSSCIDRVVYDNDTRIMKITFTSGADYTLRGVPEHHYRGLITAHSPGAYFNTHLKGKY
jgi:hypothetical protein